jgi:hypothetical protein
VQQRASAVCVASVAARHLASALSESESCAEEGGVGSSKQAAAAGYAEEVCVGLATVMRALKAKMEAQREDIEALRELQTRREEVQTRLARTCQEVQTRLSPPLSLSLCLSVCVSLSVSLCVCLSLSLSVCVCLSLSLCLSTHGAPVFILFLSISYTYIHYIIHTAQYDSATVKFVAHLTLLLFNIYLFFNDVMYYI